MRKEWEEIGNAEKRGDEMRGVEKRAKGELELQDIVGK